VAAGAPDQWKAARGETIGPVTDRVPLAGFVAVMVDALAVRLEEGDGVMLVVGAQKRRGDLAVVAADPVGDGEAEPPVIEILEGIDVESRQ